LRKIQLPAIGGIRKVIKPGTDTAPGTTIAELGGGTVTLAQLAAILTQIQKQQVNTGGGNIGDGTEAVLVPGPGLSGGGPMLGAVGIRLTAPVPWGLEDSSGGDGDPGPPGPPGRNGVTGQQGPTGPATFMSADDGTDGDIGPQGLTGIAGAIGPSGSTGAAGPPGTTLVFSNTTVPAGNTVSNTSSETFFTSSYAIPPSALAVGMVIRVKLFGVYSTGVVAPSLTLKIYFGSTVMVASGALATVAGVTNDGWSAEGLFIVQTIGAIGTVEAQGISEFSTASTAVLFVNMDNTAPITLNTTVSQTIQVSVQWGGTVSASDTITLREMTVEVMSTAGITSPVPPPPFPVFFAEDGEDGAIGPSGMQGASGVQGIPGLSGLPGATVFMIADDGADGDMGIPGVQGPQGAAGSGSSAAVPGLIPDMLYWFDASKILGTNGRIIYHLQDSTPWFTGALTSQNATSTVIISTATLNGLNVLTFPAASASGGVYPLAYPVPISNAATFFVVIKPGTANNTGGQQSIIGGASGSLSYAISTATGGTAMSLIKSALAIIGVANTSWTAGTAFQANATYNASTGAYAFRQARGAAGSGTGATGAGLTTSSWIGADFNASSGLLNTASLSELIVYNRVLTTGEITNVETYLNTKWGV
jgi:collagen type VII alpha